MVAAASGRAQATRQPWADKASDKLIATAPEPLTHTSYRLADMSKMGLWFVPVYSNSPESNTDWCSDHVKSGVSRFAESGAPCATPLQEHP